MKIRRITLYIFLLMYCIPTQAFNKQVLTDSIYNYANRYARVGKISIPRIQIRNKHANLYVSHNLSCMPFTSENTTDLRKMVSNMIFGSQQGDVRIFTDGYEVSELIPNHLLPLNQRTQPYTLPSTTPLVRNTSLPYTTDKGMEGVHLAVYGSHGLFFNQKRENWQFQRAKLLTTVEDLYTSAYTMPFLIPMLENAGAIVLQPRERDTQVHETVRDDQDGNYTQTEGKAWRYTKNEGFGHKSAPLLEGENPFTMGGYAYTETTNDPSKESRYVYYPDVPEQGEYAVYVSYHSLPNSTDAACYKVLHNGQVTTFHVNQRMGGGTWIYLGTFEFTTDRSRNSISVSNNGKPGKVVSTDAIKTGGGMGSIARYQQSDYVADIPSSGDTRQIGQHTDTLSQQDMSNAYTSGAPRYIEGARYWLQYAGIPDSVYNYSKSTNDYIDDYTSRGRWINWLTGGSAANPDAPGLGIPIHMSLAFHTDAGNKPNDSIVGTLLIYTAHNDKHQRIYPTGSNRIIAREYADYVQEQIVNDLRTLYAPEWTRRQLHNASYSETRNPEVPALILELLSHQNFADMRYGLDPRFRFSVSRAIYKGMLRFLHAQYGTPYVVQPLPIHDFAIHFTDSDAVVLTWQATPDTLESSATPTYYILQTRKDESDWDNGIRINSPQYTLPIEKGHRYDFRIAAGNAGGISLMSETLSAHIAPEEKGRVLIINGFARTSAPESFSIDSTYAGFNPSSYSVPYGKDICYIGAQYEFERKLPWRSDDNAGFGACYSDYSHDLMAGNTFDYPVMHGKILQAAGYSYVSSSASAIDSISPEFNLIDIIMGKQKESTLGTEKEIVAFRTFSPQLQKAVSEYAQQGGNILVSGAYIGSDLCCSSSATAADHTFASEILHCKYRGHNATRQGNIRIQQPLMQSNIKLHTTPNRTIIHCENPEGLTPCGKGSECVARYQDSGICAGIAYDGERRVLCFGFPLESVAEFTTLYMNCIKWLSQPL
ncbi:MAG: N-acetylmuramoyl-L-alanine amidase [Paludibacter sp.]|nr:N-acetylmuramoyl-L-alanine amidase [Bacteroidales bacterium]MCM1069121.1 N-acetylmuramoyl-L-alanine amidase [Prevotella sp.]MCM1353560.1 N-acetylmuramoyl-L-alanine amidase [Bacteroides sp.]MCM1442721.1 N-acetylmuramoyl-L-alanine amidase [Muribaculum sp.]MCM1481643.1 N-acetylmuramoyl-L-alanine amidase [Paludibacter sp.]